MATRVRAGQRPFLTGAARSGSYRVGTMSEQIEAAGGAADAVTSSGLRTRSAEALGSSTTLAAFRVPGYRALWLSEAASGFGRAATQVAIGWMALIATDSILAVGATFAARLAPALRVRVPLGGR